MLWFLSFLLLPNLAWAQSETANQQFPEATAHMRAGRVDEAAAGFEALTRSEPAFAGAHMNLGLVREQQGRNEEAIASLQKALSLKPRLRGANLFLAMAEYRLNQFDKAIAALQKETSIYPSDANAWMWLGVVQLAAENPEEAVTALDKAVKLAPENVDILYHRGRGHLLVSKNSYEKMFELDLHSWRVHQVIAQADAEADRHEMRSRNIKPLFRLFPNSPDCMRSWVPSTSRRQAGTCGRRVSAGA